MKICFQCKNSKLLNEFTKNSIKQDGLDIYCKECQKISRKNKKKPTTEQTRLYHLKSNYKITPKQWDEFFKQQNGCCAICDRHQSEFKKALHVDHNHATGEIRGLLCSPCNTAIGLLRDNPVTLEKAKLYLNKSKLKLVGS